MEHDVRDNIIDFVSYWSEGSEISVKWFIKWLGIGSSKFYNWRRWYGKVNEHNSCIPRDFWIEDWEKESIIEFYLKHPDEGYRRLTYMILDEDVAYVSPSTIYRVLSHEGLLNKWNRNRNIKGTGFRGADRSHQHCHVDISYLNITGTFYYLLSIIDGYSRYIIHWEIRESMRELDVEIVIQRAREKFPEASPRIISDRGPQFVSRDFKEFIKLNGMAHVFTSLYYPQSNGKKERWYRTLKSERIGPRTPLSLKKPEVLFLSLLNIIILEGFIQLLATCSYR